MALLKCPECGHDVSSLADRCQNCGAPVAVAIAAEEECRAKLSEEEAERQRIIQEKLKFSEPDALNPESQKQETNAEHRPSLDDLADLYMQRNSQKKDRTIEKYLALGLISFALVGCVFMLLFTCVFGNHKYDNGTVTLEPTCGAVGRITYTCKKCGDQYGASIPMQGEHTWVEATAAYPKHCAVCNEMTGGALIDGHWRDRMEDHAQFEFVIDTKAGTYVMNELFESTKYGNDCKLFEGTITSYSENQITTSGGWVFVYNSDDTVTVKDADFLPYPLTRYSNGTEQTKVAADLVDPSKTVVQEKPKSGTYTSVTFTNAEAFTAAEMIVKDSLKSPSTAKFCKVTEATITKLSSSGDYMVEGWVDAENSFGAVLRSDFLVTFTPIKDGKDIGYKNASCIIN